MIGKLLQDGQEDGMKRDPFYLKISPYDSLTIKPVNKVLDTKVPPALNPNS
jgi:hypothetical protein